uniref:Phycoerythrin alpha chain domain-containing protein n=1 Tax=Hemiselmis andersenii TaxID=464988 RepID=A0A6T8KJ38_HEMAN
MRLYLLFSCLVLRSALAFHSTLPYPAPRVVGASVAGPGMLRMELQPKPKERFYLKKVKAPFINLFNNPGCARKNTEYKGPKSGDLDDERLVFVRMETVRYGEKSAIDMVDNCVRLFNSFDSRIQIANRIREMNTEAKAKGLPPSKWPFPPDYIGYEPYLDVVKQVMKEDLPPSLRK